MAWSRISRNRRIALVLSGMTILGGGVAISMGTTFAADSDNVCAGLAKAKQNNENFIAAQQELAQQNPGQAAVFEGRIANRQAVIDLIESRQQAAGCGDTEADTDAGADTGAEAGSGQAAAGGDIGCDALARAKQNNENFIAAQQELAQQNPGQAAVFEGRIANREAVIDLIESRQQAAGCDAAGDDAAAQDPAAQDPAAQDPAAEDAAAEDDAAEDAEAVDEAVGNPATGGNDIGCDNLARAKQNNENFIAAQQELAQQNPGQAAVFEGRIANRQAVIDLIESRQQAAGCL